MTVPAGWGRENGPQTSLHCFLWSLPPTQLSLSADPRKMSHQLPGSPQPPGLPLPGHIIMKTVEHIAKRLVLATHLIAHVLSCWT